MYDKMYVRGILIRNNKILLEKINGVYQLPGGVVIDNEFPKEALIRNFYVKYGLHITVRRGRVYDLLQIPLEYIYFVKTDDDVLDPNLKWISIDQFFNIPFYQEQLKQKMLEHFPSYDEMEDVIFIENTN